MHEFEDFVERTLEASDIEELGRLFQNALAQEGLENFCLAEVSAFKLKRVALCQFPDGFLAYYRDQKLERIDPIINLTLRATSPFSWDEALPRTMTKRQTQFMAESREIGVYSGITMPFRGPGNRVDLVSISRRKDDPPSERKRLAYLYALSAQVWQRSLDFEATDARAVGEPIPRLSAREIECLAFSRDGVSYNEIGERLNISNRTVEYHMYSAMRKLGVRDKITAVVKAIHYGLI
jgi:DNA-binding CsgD family transcriptional regulator